MDFQFITTVTDFNALADEWNVLLKNSASHVPFLRHEYVSTWWQTMGGGEWPHGELWIVTAREGHELVGIAPLFLAQNHAGELALMLLGSFEISDYLDFIVLPEHLPAFLAGLLEHLRGSEAPAWQVIDCYNLLETSPTLPVLSRLAAQKGWTYTQEPLQHCPYIPLPGDWETYLAQQVDKKQRHEIRRKMRRAEENEIPVQWYIVTDPETLADEIDAFLELMANDEAKARFLTGAMRSQMRAVVQAAFGAGWLQLAFITVGGEKAAAYLNFDYANHIWVYNSGLDFRFRELSPGWVLLGYLLEWANANHRAAFDFMRGNEDYKYRFGAVDRRVVRATVRK